MDILFFGILLLVSAITVIVGAPLVYYIRRETRWEKSGKTIEAWYATN